MYLYLQVIREKVPPVMMAKAGKDAIEMDGIVTDALPNAMFRVELEANKQVCFFI